MAVTEEQKREREQIAAQISKAAEVGVYHFRLLQPTTLTVKQGHQFKKKPFIGEEIFAVKTAYVGKRGGIIVVFEPYTASEYASIEIPIMDCETLLEGWPNWRAGVLKEFEGDGIHIPLKPVAPTPPEELMTDPNFGSW